jgi:hypothetical protein
VVAEDGRTVNLAYTEAKAASPDRIRESPICVCGRDKDPTKFPSMESIIFATRITVSPLVAVSCLNDKIFTRLPSSERPLRWRISAALKKSAGRGIAKYNKTCQQAEWKAHETECRTNEKSQFWGAEY